MREVDSFRRRAATPGAIRPDADLAHLDVLPHCGEVGEELRPRPGVDCDPGDPGDAQRRRDEARGARDVRRTPPVAVPASALATAASSIRPTKPSANSELVRLLAMGDAGWNVSFMDPPTVIVDTW